MRSLGEILTQSEIDELLRALNTGEIDVEEITEASEEKKIVKYDFSRPSKFSKDHLRALKNIYENYARLVTNFLTGYLRALVQMDVVEVQALTYYDFIGSISNPVVLPIVKFAPLEGSAILEMTPKIAFAFIDRVLGGRFNTTEENREFTEIELAIIERIIIQMLNIMKEPWKDVIQLKPVLEKIETNTQFAQIISPNEIVALVTFDVRVSDVQGMFNVCIPYISVEPIISRLNTRYWFSNIKKQHDEYAQKMIQAKISETKAPVKAILGNTKITVSDLMELQVGDVLPLNKNINEEIDVYVADLHKFKAKPGVRKSRLAIKITSLVGKEDL